MKDIIEKSQKNLENDIEKWIDGEEIYLTALSLSFFNDKEIFNYAKRRYDNDKQNYLKCGTWNKPVFYDRDKLWTYYYWLQLWDKDINLQVYFDYDYDTNIWTREKIQETLKNYNEKYLFNFLRFLHSNLNISFEEFLLKSLQFQNNITNPLNEMFEYKDSNKKSK